MNARDLRRVARRIRHVREAIRYRHVVHNWTSIVLRMLGVRHGSVTARVDGGLQFALAHPSDAWTLIQLVGRNDYRLAAREPWHAVVDIGANIGVFAVLAARAARAAHVYCYEPSEETCRLLERNLALNGVGERVTVVQRAVAGAPGPVWVTAEPESSLRRTQRERSAPRTAPVEAVTLEGVFAAHGIGRCDFLKVDCEGAEYEIFRSCPASVLARIDRIAAEVHDWAGTRAELFDLLRRAGFHVEPANDPLDPRVGYLFAHR